MCFVFPLSESFLDCTQDSSEIFSVIILLLSLFSATPLTPLELLIFNSSISGSLSSYRIFCSKILKWHKQETILVIISSFVPLLLILIKLQIVINSLTENFVLT